MAEYLSSLGKFLNSERMPALTDEELVRLEAAAELEQAKALEVLESEGGSHRDPESSPATGG